MSRAAVLGLACLLALLFTAVFAAAQDKLPPAPKRHFNDYAGVVPAEAAATLDAKLAQFERDTSNQILVAVFPKLETDSSMEDFTQRTAASWRVGQADKDNGAVLFVFVQDRKMRIEVGYGLEGALPDATAKRIIAEEIAPAFRTGNYAAGLAAGVDAMMKATRGEYTGSGRLASDQEQTVDIGGWICPILFLLFLFFLMRRARRGTEYSRRGRRGLNSPWILFPPSGGGWGGGGGFGGGFGGGGGGFSGGGGDFGGGGASGDW